MAAPIRTLTVDKEFSAEGRKLTTEEENFLYAGLVTDGCREPIVVWAGHNNTILDGHNRYRLCRENKIPFDVIELSLPDRKACIEWIRGNQLGRRNLTEEEKSYLRGKRYEQEKKKEGAPKGNRNATKQRGQSVQVDSPADKVGAEFGVDGRTVRRDAKFSKAVDTLADVIGPHAKDEILSGESEISKQEIEDIAEMHHTHQPEAYHKAKSQPRVIKSDNEKLVDQINQIVVRVDRMAASHLGHNDQSKRVVRLLKDCLAAVKAMQKSWRNK